MSLEEVRRRKKSNQFDVLVVPVGEGERTRSLRTSRLRLGLLVGGAFVLCCVFVFVILVYSPAAMFVPIPNAALEKRYGDRIFKLQHQLTLMVEDVMVLKDYNQQLRKALGEGATGDSTTGHGGSSLIVENAGSQSSEANVSGPTQQPVQQQEPVAMDEGVGSVELALTGGYTTVLTGGESGRSVFPLMMPVEGMMSQGFDPAQSHFGIDFAGKRGATISAAADGHVVFAGWTYDDGNMVIMAHDGGYLTVYKHAQSLLTTTHSTVRRGEPLALLGDSGRTSMGPHLHFELWKDGRPRDPNAYLIGINTGSVQ